MMKTETCGCVYNDAGEVEHLCPLHYEAVTTMGAKDNPALRLACDEVAIIARERDRLKNQVTSLIAQLEEMTADRDNEAAWAAQYKAERDTAIRSACELFAFDDDVHTHWMQYTPETRELIMRQSDAELKKAALSAGKEQTK